ncbi:uncharacterized protein MONBRDRAFT_25294 [Monosiga brevicollis MX1]|uniref:Centriolar and ciliogenesis-associated protein HYLS1 C-terminal domain-containing protein n=1 Tax=Monosiga brevicollis TaxID=81824 RepID=A9UYZ5_MONBE|nr:uncharacterized protein MONBRDRAFT_25294 [Monosiga brevicollis MX1]EDQ89544.1 predicted protein [Monosiga brevicollis MX1]|eukprot:XP_001745573.1 hypothetical protein [Monosiga brevicollis MX1]
MAANTSPLGGAIGPLPTPSWFTKRDVRRQLAYLGYYDVPDEVLAQFTQDLIDLATQADSAPPRASGPARDPLVQQPLPKPGPEPEAVQERRSFPRGRQSLAAATNAGATAAPRTPMKGGSRRKTAVIPSAPAPPPTGPGNVAPVEPATAVEQLFEQLDQLRLINDETAWPTDEGSDADATDDLRPFPDELNLEMYDDYDPHSLAGRRGHALPSVAPVEAIEPVASRTSVIYQHRRPKAKTDVVRRGELYRQAWQYRKVPGQDAHHDVRWNTRQALQRKTNEQRPPSKPTKKPATSSDYVVPTTKKRSALRWAVRMHLNELR